MMTTTPRTARTLLTPLVLLALAGGCGNNLAYVHNAVVGVDVTAATDGTARIAVGYDNDTFAVVPRFKKDGESQADAMNLVSVSNVDIDALDEIVFNHVIATGDAAVNVANDQDGLKMMRNAVYGAQPEARK